MENESDSLDLSKFDLDLNLENDQTVDQMGYTNKEIDDESSFDDKNNEIEEMTKNI